MTSRKQRIYPYATGAAAVTVLLLLSGCGKKDEPAVTVAPSTAVPAAATNPAAGAPPAGGGMQPIRPGMPGVPK